MDIKLIILMGLPGSGKTTFSKNYLSKNKLNNKLSIYCLDKSKSVLEKPLLKNKTEIMIDGLILTNDDIIKLYKKITEVNPKRKIKEIYIHHWNENREKCLKNDNGRRTKNSTTTIKHAIYEKVDIDRIKKETNCKVIVETHDIIEKETYRQYFDKNFGIDNNILKSERWCAGGCYGNCWDDELIPISAESPIDFIELDELLLKICPNINFLLYKKIMRECISIEETYESDYYGGGVTYNYYQCDLKKLYNILEENKLLN